MLLELGFDLINVIFNYQNFQAYPNWKDSSFSV